MSHGPACSMCHYAMVLKRGDVWRCPGCGLGIDGSRASEATPDDVPRAQRGEASSTLAAGMTTPPDVQPPPEEIARIRDGYIEHRRECNGVDCEWYSCKQVGVLLTALETRPVTPDAPPPPFHHNL